ncbi:hypothetical protein MLD38_034112 [Melastoma candidum]|uniref:Uncharacterized protein n=1 Tax=Melastoma candidum TaxID=119954 RepID=A0ACB9MCR7_9MYRT|nr:hypothetical protein MLD38_034112 [Melastoma candidum]
MRMMKEVRVKRRRNEEPLKGPKEKKSSQSARSKALLLKMSFHKLEIEKFNGSNDFTLWKVKMQALLVQ